MYRIGIAIVLTLFPVQAVALLWLDLNPTSRGLWGDEVMYWDIASRWATGQPATLEPLWPPLYPQFLATILRAGGSRLTVQVIQLTMVAGAAWLLYELVRRLLGAPTAVAAAAFLLLDPQLVAFGLYFWPEIPHLLLALAAALVAVARPDGWGWNALLGALLGLALLTKNLLAPFLLVLAVRWIATSGTIRLRALAIALAALIAVVTPTLLENGRRHGAYIIGDSMLFNVWVGINDTERRNLINEIVGLEYDRYRKSADRHADRNRILGAKIRAFVEERGPWPVFRAQLGRQYFRLFDKDSFFTDQLPGSGVDAPGFGYRSLGPLQAAAIRSWAYAIYLTVLVLAPFGVRAVWGRHRPTAVVMLGYLGLTLAMCLIVHVKTRYRVQFLPALYLFAAAALVEWHDSRLGVKDGRVLLPLCLAGGSSALLVFLALGRVVIG
jgi:4-amino-4-deoxy-L-arabinose transferase-like glycosyltransferase